jgi:poly-gamma-glutamate synthesis protein (capsule biosynthesis protein)
LKCGDIGLVALANNHIMDYGSEGISDTLRLCKSKDINFVGVGSSPEKASEPFTMVIKNRRIAIFNYAENEFISASDGDWNCNPIDNQNMYYDLHQAREANDFIFVFVHAGNEYFKLPSPRLQRLFRYLVDLGADAVIASHTHVFSGYEIYKSKPIFYGLGNFIYDWPGKRNMEWNRGFGVKFSLSERVDFELIPFLQGNEQPGVFCLNNIERDEFFREINMLNKMISDEKMLESEFTKNCRSIFPMYDGYIEPYFGKFISKLRHLGFFPRLMGKRKRLLLLNIIRCESHRDVLLKILGQYE